MTANGERIRYVVDTRASQLTVQAFARFGVCRGA